MAHTVQAPHVPTNGVKKQFVGHMTILSSCNQSTWFRHRAMVWGMFPHGPANMHSANFPTPSRSRGGAFVLRTRLQVL